ncbi:hypothetical protein C2G38_2209600 [Gigaspora rosea]|uniref:Uncharacterized protein n=1 Tax=Gigaspora rosea TaxID=44941 RepID=A0A397UG64_9GLOM|nr:hypothetical protein C2G38_2209600 [Gigaspora rosea]
MPNENVQEQMTKNSPHSVESVQEFTIQHQSAESTQEQIPENSPHNAEGVQERTPENSSKTNAREFTTQCKGVQEYQRIHYIAKSAQGQMPENLPHNAEGVQEQIPENLRIYHTTRSVESVQEQIPENSSHNAKGVQEQTPKNLSYAQRQMLENLPHNTKVFKNTREFITLLKVPKDKCQKIHHTMPKVFKNKHQRIQKFTTQCEGVQEHQRIHHSAESVQGQMPENSLHNAKGFKITPENSLQCQNVKSTQEQIPKNSPHNAKSVQGHAQKINNAEDA